MQNPVRLRIVAVATVIAASAAGGTVALAAAVESYDAKAAATKGGTAKKPIPVAASFEGKGVPKDGDKRLKAPRTITWSWTGVTDNASRYPTCSASQIADAQSDSVCPKGSLIAKGTKARATLGPANDMTSAVDCEKEFTIYNAGPGKEVLYISGDPSKCAGVGYVPPSPLKVTKKGNTRTVVWDIPAALTEPLPGVTGGFVEFGANYSKRTVKKGGKSYGYLQSNGCKGTRTFTLTVKKADGTTSKATTKAGNC